MKKFFQSATIINDFARENAVSNFAFLLLVTVAVTLQSCKQETAGKGLKQIDTARAASMAASIESLVKPELAEGLTMR